MILIYLYLLYSFLTLSQSLELVAESSLMRCSANEETVDNSTKVNLIHTVENCNWKIRITLNIKNVHKSPEEVKYIFIKDVLDIDVGKKLRLLNPLAIRFRQDQVLLAYPMRFLTSVNARAYEVVINYQNALNFTGCDDESPINPTCGFKHERGSTVEYSQGFCCFCPQVPTKGHQARGGQDCSLAQAPSPQIRLMEYKGSAHCLKKSNVWYIVNAIDQPIIMHQNYIQLYILKHFRNSSSGWFALTGQDDYSLGAANPFQYDENKTIAVTQVTQKPLESEITIPYDTSNVLIPQPLYGADAKDIPDAVKKGPSDFLVISKDVIESNGDVCDKAGVSYEGFALQENRCDAPKNTCLKNQPFDFWESDNDKQKQGTKGSYLLKNFGVPYKNPIVIEKKTREHWLALEYYKPQHTVVHAEIKADDIVVLEVGKFARILYVITESTAKDINFYASIENAGLVSAEFTTEVSNCGFSVPGTNAHVEIIAPQTKIDVVVRTKPGGIQISEKYKCTVRVSSSAYGVVAKRDVVVKPRTRCICNLHCLCACLGESLVCEPMTVQNYNQAGFRGSLPVFTATPPYKPWPAKHPREALVLLFLTLLLIGFTKGTCGVAGLRFIGEIGLFPMLYKPGKIKQYDSPELMQHPVVYDNKGYPLHPNTNTRYRRFSKTRLFCLNLFFCFTCPCSQLARWICKRKSNPGFHDISESDLSDDGNYKVQTTQPVSSQNMPRSALSLPRGMASEEFPPKRDEKFKGKAVKLTHYILKDPE